MELFAVGHRVFCGSGVVELAAGGGRAAAGVAHHDDLCRPADGRDCAQTHAQHAADEKSRALQAIWTAMGLGIFVFAFPVAWSGHFQAQSFMAGIEAMLGIAHVASGSFLRWPLQIVVGAAWWVAAIASCFVKGNGIGYVFLAATFVCNIGFGIYLMVRESREKARAGAGEVQHA